ncbi:Restriction endonuclease BglII [Desulfovibrio sp. X2]|uniref:BglII/BstYI family type II restriction endonuclease n=1 Tax=Desulfovibrio sp. X2 TaxID=941449 RepID=UPI00035893E3|nr:BglII/BstYI family type II restriction endonuclease [Desulfovibrio sp. X2]EPR41631.1 Restriction endonuclease BglII [Desulfovibrio sp. X2]
MSQNGSVELEAEELENGEAHADELEGNMQDDIACGPGPNADQPDDYEQYISSKVRNLYDVYSYRHAASILANSFPDEYTEIEQALLSFELTTTEIGTPGGNESVIPRKFSSVLRPAGWVETRIQGDLLIRLKEYEEQIIEGNRSKKSLRPETPPHVIKNFIDGHKIDYVKGRVAFDLEWNSKDQTFDRDLYALRTFHECGIISVGVLVTRSARLNPIFDSIPRLGKDGRPVFYTGGKKAGQPMSVKDKYGASTTWMGKLLYRLNAGRHGGCPVLVFGITEKLIADWKTKK